MNVFGRLWTGIVAAVAGVAISILVQIVGQMTLGFPIDYLKWIALAFAGIGFLAGVLIGPRGESRRTGADR